ncbi:hypothetical protein IL306_004380 [Fusarium sp. DS 682]|nr:hypothetical protein IL306_004380 [Fusarium sp. DS 682]
MPVLEPPAEEQHQDPEKENRQSLIGLPDTAWAMPVRNSSFETGSIIHQHVDDDDSNSDQDRAQATKKHNTAFDNVRNKLIGSISHSSNNDHPSHVSVGNSEEEIARRAELKRIMHQRIQNELKSDESDDHIENKPTNGLPCMASVADLTLPNSGPRDAIEFGMSKSSSRNGKSAQLDSDQVDQDTPRDSQVSQQAAIRSKSGSSQESELIDGRNYWRKDAAPSSPSVTCLPRHVSLSEDAGLAHSQKSFQLSNGAGRLDRVLGPDSSFNSRHASSGDGHSVLGVWLIAQGLRSRDNSTLFLDEEDELEPTEVTKLTNYNTSLSRGEKEEQAQEPQETSANENLEVPQEPTMINPSDTVETNPRFSFNAQHDRHKISSLSGELPWGPTVTALLNSFTDHTSSSDPSKSPPSPMRSQQNLYKLDPKDLESMELSPFKCKAKSESTVLKRKEGISSTPKANYLLVPVERLGGHERETSNRSKGRSNLSIRPHMSRLPTEEYRKPSLERRESATDLWQRAIRLEAERRHSSSIHLSTPKLGQRSQSSNMSPNGTGAARNSTSSVSDMRREVSQLTPTTDELSSPGNSKWLIERWVATMRPKTGESARHMSSALFMGPPRSWSRFPSHTREERNKNAADRDRVQPRDFAIKHMTSEGQIRWATDVPLGEEKQRSRTLPRSFSTKFGELVKSKMGRIIPSKGVRRRVSQDHFIRHPALSLALMEYPEMGIRPSESGYTELQALGREISNMKGESHLQTPERELSKPHSSRSLGDRVVALMHEAIGQRHSKHDAAVESAECPTVPLTPSLVRESLAATDVFVTPRSRFSNDALNEEEKNCVETESTKMKGQKTQLTLPESDDNTPHNNFSTSIKEVRSDTQLTIPKKAST